MTNFERIINMTVEEMAALIIQKGCYPCEYCEYFECNDSPGCVAKCAEGIKKFLESEIKQND